MKSFTPQETIETLNNILAIEQRASGIDYLRQLLKRIAQTLKIKFVFVGHAVGPDGDAVLTDVVWAGDDFAENFTYSLENTPCENVLSGHRVCVYREDVAAEFPKDKLLAEMGVRSYVGAPLLKSDGGLLGILVFLDENPITDAEFFRAIVQFLAGRACAELERYYFEEELKRQVVERTAALEKSNQELREALAEIKSLRGIVPVCSNCKKIRDDQGYWQQVDAYLASHTDASISHGICPQCVDKLYGEVNSRERFRRPTT